jgi:hypothetical protein
MIFIYLLKYLHQVTWLDKTFTLGLQMSSLKAKAVPVHTRRRLEQRNYSSYSFSTSTLDVGEWSASRPGRSLTPGKGLPVLIVQEAGWAPEPLWIQRLEKNPLPLPGIEPRSPGRPGRSQTLYWLSYPAYKCLLTLLNFYLKFTKTFWFLFCEMLIMQENDHRQQRITSREIHLECKY